MERGPAHRGSARLEGALCGPRRDADAPPGATGRNERGMASVLANSLSIESGALAVPEPDASGVRVYKGIPYATPPIGRLRWRPPEPAAAWTGVRPTREFGAHS